MVAKGDKSRRYFQVELISLSRYALRQKDAELSECSLRTHFIPRGFLEGGLTHGGAKLPQPIMITNVCRLVISAGMSDATRMLDDDCRQRVNRSLAQCIDLAPSRDGLPAIMHVSDINVYFGDLQIGRLLSALRGKDNLINVIQP